MIVRLFQLPVVKNAISSQRQLCASFNFTYCIYEVLLVFQIKSFVVHQTEQKHLLVNFWEYRYICLRPYVCIICTASILGLKDYAHLLARLP